MVDSCGTCEECRAGQEQNCLEGNVGTYNATDVDGTIAQGGYAQKVVVDERFVCRIPDGLDFDVAAPLLCAGITAYAPLGPLGRRGLQGRRPEEGRRAGSGRPGPHGHQDRRRHGRRRLPCCRAPRKKEQLAIELGAQRRSPPRRTASSPTTAESCKHHPQHDQRRHPRRQVPEPAQAPRRDGRGGPAAAEAAAQLRLGHRRRQGAGRFEHRRHRRDPGDARFLRRARDRRADRDDRDPRGGRRLRARGRRRGLLPRRHRHRDLRGRRGRLDQPSRHDSARDAPRGAAGVVISAG